jgi:ATP/maltotriose-dependent transcriptional regulator MalT
MDACVDTCQNPLRINRKNHFINLFFMVKYRKIFKFRILVKAILKMYLGVDGMNSIPILKSKLIMPELSTSFLLTERLKKLHKDMDVCRAVTLCAPAGYGKTSLALSYFNLQAAMPSRVCWFRLDPEDKNLSIFITHLYETLFPSDVPEFRESRKVLEDYADMQLQPHHTISMLCQEIWSHTSQNDYNKTYIVLDDFQNVAQVQDICDIIKFMLDNLPPSCTIFILSRANLTVFTEKQKLEKKVLEIGIDDLAFNNAEIEELMLNMGQTGPIRKLTNIIAKNTEGWIAGIIILYHAAKSKNLDTASFEPTKLSHDDALFRYMSAEVLKSVENDTQDVLAKLALLQDFSEIEASEILETNDIKSSMEKCMGFGMFIQRIPGDPVVYRFHSLFREFLLYILKCRYSDEYIAGLHLKAAGYYINHATYGRAAEHIAKCGSSASALDMVIKVGFNKFLIGETAQLKIWLDLLPEEMIRDNPILLMYKAQLMPNSRQPEMVDPLKKVIRQSLLDNNLEVYFNVATVLIYILICNNDMKGLLEMTPDISNQLQNASEELRNTFVILDIVRSIGEERFSVAELQSESILYNRLPEDSQWLYLILSCIVYICLGKLDPAERCMKKALILHNFKGIEPARGFILLFLATTLSLKNEKEYLPSHIAEILAIGKKYDYEYLSANGRRLAAFERYLSLDIEVSLEMLDYSVFHYHQISNKVMAAACRLLRRLWTIQNNSPVQFLDEARKDFAIISKSCPGIMVYETSQSILGAIARESGDFLLSERCLLSSIKASKAKKGYQVLCGSYLHIARLYYANGDMQQGHCYLKQAMELAASNKYYMFWDIHIPTLVEMMLRSIRYGYFASHAEELLSKSYSNKTVMYLSEKIKSIDESLITSFVYDFVSTYKENKPLQLYFVKASLFGMPEILVNGIKIPDTEWKTKKVKNFMEYLLLNSGNTVSKEALTEILWPSADSKSAVASQRTALYYLRKILSKYNAEITGSNAFIYETLEGLQIRKNDALELDIHEFLRLYNQLSQFKKHTLQIELSQADILKKMVDLYKGDLMEGSDYGDLIFYERERFKSIFMEACQKLSSIYIMHGELREAEEILRRALAAEPYNENLCLELLKLYMLQGRRSKAVKFYYSFKKHIEQELDIKIDKRLTEAIQSPRFESSKT